VAPDSSLVVTASSDHVQRRSIGGTAHHFSNEVRLSSRNHIPYAWDRIKELIHCDAFCPKDFLSTGNIVRVTIWRKIWGLN
jgi:hypothetical protein